jgi:hypothetical protein
VPELYTIDPPTGQEQLVGTTGTGSGVLESLEHVVVDETTSRLIAGGQQLWELDPASGLATPIGGSYEMLWGLAINAAVEPTLVPALHPSAVPLLGALLAACGLALGARRRR